MRVPELMRGEASAHPRCDRGISQLRADAGCRARPSASRAAQHAEQCANGQAGAYGEPRLKLLPGPTVHPDFATLIALAVAHEHRAPTRIQIALGQRERFADPQPRTPQDDDQTAQPDAVCIIADDSHDSDNLLDGRWSAG
jgi:hypothetical protein